MSPDAVPPMRRSLGALALLGVAYMTHEWRDTLGAWSWGRDVAEARVPYACGAVALAAAALFTLGVAWRAAAALFCAAFALVYAIAPVTYHNNLYLLATLMLLFALFGRSASLGALVRAQVALVYIASAVVKAAHPMWGGTGQAIRWLALVRVPALNQGIFNPLMQRAVAHRPIAALLDAATIAAELAIPLLLLSPRSRRAGIAAGAALHLSMQAWLFPQLFTFLMLWGYYAFVPFGDRAWVVRFPPSLARFARLYARVDWLRRSAWNAGEALSITSPEGRTWRGALALPWLVALTPLSLVAFAALSLVAPSHRSPLGVSRDALEDVLILAWGTLWCAVFVVTPPPGTTVITRTPE